MGGKRGKRRQISPVPPVAAHCRPLPAYISVYTYAPTAVATAYSISVTMVGIV
jgi:hypothetical protein